MPAPPGEGVEADLRLLRCEADHVDHHVKRAGGSERGCVIAIPVQLTDLWRNRAFPLATVEDSNLYPAVQQVFDDSRADEARAADDESGLP